MTPLVDVCPEEVVRAAAGCGGLAEELSGAVVGLRGAEVPDWVSGPAESYGHRLLVLGRSLRGASGAFEEVASALVEFARVLREVRVLAERARAAGWDAERLRADRLRPVGDPLRDFVLGPEGPAERVLAEQARAWAVEAERLHGLGVLRVVAVLEVAAGRAPVGRGRLRRTGGHVWEGLEGPLVGFGRVVESLATSLPGLGTVGSRREGRQVLVDAGRGLVSPWEAFEELRRELGEHQFGRAAGLVAGEVVLRRAGARGWKVELFGAHDVMHEQVLRALRRSSPADAWGAGLVASEWVAERAQVEFLSELGRLRDLPLPGVEQLVRQGADLIQHEAYGGHTILKHLGRSVEWLRHRQEVDPKARGAVSSFLDLAEAERVVGQALEDGGEEIRTWVASGEPYFELNERLSEPAGLVIDGDGVEVAASRVIVRFVRTRSGAIAIATAFLR